MFRVGIEEGQQEIDDVVNKCDDYNRYDIFKVRYDGEKSNKNIEFLVGAVVRNGRAWWCRIHDINFSDLKYGEKKMRRNIFVLMIDAIFHNFQDINTLLLKIIKSDWERKFILDGKYLVNNGP